MHLSDHPVRLGFAFKCSADVRGRFRVHSDQAPNRESIITRNVHASCVQSAPLYNSSAVASAAVWNCRRAKRSHKFSYFKRESIKLYYVVMLYGHTRHAIAYAVCVCLPTSYRSAIKLYAVRHSTAQQHNTTQRSEHHTAQAHNTMITPSRKREKEHARAHSAF